MTRIPANKSTIFSTWDMPEVKQGQVIQAEKLKNRGPRGELINVDKNAVVYNNLTAQQLEEISNQAYEEVREQAYQDGLKQGYDEGLQQGQQAAQQTLQQQTAALHQAISDLYSYLDGQDDEVEQALVNIATCIASSILRRELTIDASHMQAVIADAIALLPMSASNIIVFVSQQDHALFKELQEIPDNWQLQVDQSLSSGGCRVHCGHSVVDYTLEDQFQQTVNQLVEKRFATLAAKSTGAAGGSEPSDEI